MWELSGLPCWPRHCVRLCVTEGPAGDRAAWLSLSKKFVSLFQASDAVCDDPPSEPHARPSPLPVQGSVRLSRQRGEVRKAPPGPGCDLSRDRALAPTRARWRSQSALQPCGK